MGQIPGTAENIVLDADLEEFQKKVVLIENIKQTLWKGTWSENTITVENTSDYLLFQIGLANIGTSILAMRYGNYIRGIGGYSSATPTVTLYHFAATISGNDWTLVACNAGAPYSDSTALTNLTVSRITGII